MDGVIRYDSGLGAEAGRLVGRYSDLVHDGVEVRALGSHLDFRDPLCRREVFLRFYQFHLRYRAHPGCVYYLMPYLADTGGWKMEERLWFAFINGCTQNPVTSLVIFRRFPRVPWKVRDQAKLSNWFNAEWARLPFDTDRRYQKRQFVEAVCAYARWTQGGTQTWAFDQVMQFRKKGPEFSFDRLWELVRGSSNFVGFGRLGTWSYLEYLRIVGLDLEPSSMMLGDRDGSKSHRNGLAIVLGRDDLDWRRDSAFQGRYSPRCLEWMERECDLLLNEAEGRMRTVNVASEEPVSGRLDVSRFTLESALCTYKGWHRPNRRYPNVYNDMLRDRIEHVQKLWPEEPLSVFWDARRHYLPAHLRVEDCPGDPGVSPAKQNHYRLTGRPVMMGEEWPVFRDDKKWMKKT